MQTAGKNSYIIVRDESGQNVIEVTDKVAVVPITTQRQVPTTQWKVQKTPMMSQVQHSARHRDAHVPQVEEGQTADVATHSPKLEADVQ